MQAITQRQCPTCLRSFDYGVMTKVYCSLRCRNGAKNKRAVARDKQIQLGVPVTPSPHRSVSDSPIVMNATIEVLEEYAEKLRSGAMNTSIKVMGLIPEWKSPYADVVFAQQFTKPGEPEMWMLIPQRLLDIPSMAPIVDLPPPPPPRKAFNPFEILDRALRTPEKNETN